MIRMIKTALTLAAVAAAGLGLRWVTADSLASASRDDLASLAVVAIGAVAWGAYAWLVVVTSATALEQLPGALGQIAGTIATGLTSAGSRTLIRSTLGIAAVTPLTVGLAHAAPPAPSSAWTAFDSTRAIDPPARAPSYAGHEVEPASEVDLGHPPSTTYVYGQAEPPSHINLSPGVPSDRPAQPSPSGDRNAPDHPETAGRPHTAGRPDVTRHFNVTTRPDGTDRPNVASDPVAIGRPGDTSRPVAADRPDLASRPVVAGRTEVTSRTAGARRFVVAGRSEVAGRPWEVEPPGGRGDRRVVERRIAVPDRPTVGAPTRYTPIRAPRQLVVRPGDTLWSIARDELGPNSTDQAIAIRWPDWFAVNAAVIGPDPHYLEPGQILQQPAPSAEVRRLSPTSKEY
ncbi:LysM peptidoglycan-binding domain-containing protein [Kribbella deserti]|uniref:LysM domain-containing protein n=1 Tax=Kribbella deserti TaxID=1926257 RepID=A0ABV6QR04_9ACTN